MSWLPWRTPAAAPPPQPDPREAIVMSAWEHTPATWARLTDQQRATCRRDLVLAPRYAG